MEKVRFYITGSMLYNLVQCPHRLYLDLFGDPSKKDPESKFLQMLWERGTLFEQEVIGGLKIPFTDLSGKSGYERERLTREAIERGDSLIYAGRIRAGNLLGDPDILRREGEGWVAGDIKSGAALEGVNEGSEGRIKEHYAVQLALYTDILERMGISAGRLPFIWDIHGEEVVYNLQEPVGKRDKRRIWNLYNEHLEFAERIINRRWKTTPAMVGVCKICHWRSYCYARMEEMDDLSLIPECGRSRRDAMMGYFKTVSELARTNIDSILSGKKTLIKGVGKNLLQRFYERARLQKTPGAKPLLKQPLKLPDSNCELFMDIETDPMREICYLHGFVERYDHDNSTERYVPFFAEGPTPDSERRAFSEAWAYVQSRQPCIVYYYSKYERIWWYRLQERYPEVLARGEVEALFSPGRSVDLYYDVVQSHTEWPTRDYSIKTLARYLGFSWRDQNPSGVESIEWYYRWVESGDESIRKRILEYNEDDCKAMRVILDAIPTMEIHYT
ncbi:MAG: TM0106 family RecB-like putative nuclease [Spirochaetota bacterium]